MLRRRQILALPLLPFRAAAALPAQSCDTHTHIFGDPARFPFAPTRLYTPPPASPQEMSRLHRGLGVERVVIVTPSVYGTDNASTLYGMKTRGKMARGVAVIGERTSERELNDMAKAGVRGVRLSFPADGFSVETARQQIAAIVKRIRPLGWHLQMNAPLGLLRDLEADLQSLSTPVVIDHVANAKPALGLAKEGFGVLLSLVKSGRAYVKITHRFLPSGTAPDYSDSKILAWALIEANPERILWGTDWPHPDSGSGRPPTELSPALKIDDAALLGTFASWLPDAGLRQKIFVANPARLYEF
jgi:predicted TIM-barrel fold metal-dependent hydrolase